MNWFNSLPSSPLVTLALLVLAVASIVLAVIFYFRGRRVKVLSWAISTTNVIGPDTPPLPELSIHYAREAVGSLSLSAVSIWNAGTESISGHDISPAVPLALVTSNQDVRILDCTVTLASNKAAGITTEHKDHTHVDICFHYLNIRDGCVMRVVHTGTTSDDLTVSGGIQGVKTISRIRLLDRRLQSVTMLGMMILGFLLAMAFVTTVPLPVPGVPTTAYFTTLGWRFWIAFGSTVLILGLLYYRLMDKYIRPRLQSVPPQFNVTLRP